MRNRELRVDCDYFTTQTTFQMVIGGEAVPKHHHQCGCPGAPNYVPSMDHSFAQGCASCSHNRWQENAEPLR